MAKERIKIDDVELHISSGKQFSYKGTFSGKELAGIELRFGAKGQENIDLIEDLVRRDKVFVNDPFVEKEYEANIKLKSSSYQEGVDERSYVCEVEEVDAIPDFDILEINGSEFQVINYRESIHEKDKIGRYALLRLNENEFTALTKMFDLKVVDFRRIGIDDEPLQLRFSGGMYWSHHEEGDNIYYKQIVTFFPTDLEPSKINLASGNIQNALVQKVLALQVTVENLVEELLKTKTLDEKKKEELLSKNWRENVFEERLLQLFNSVYQVADAEDERL